MKSGPGVSPGPLFRSSVALPLLAAHRPRADALGLEHVVGNPNLLVATGLVGRTAATVGAPGAHRELQATVVTVPGGGVPVAARLARRDGIPVHTVAAFAVPVPSAIGTTTSAPAMVLSPNVLRMFLNFDPFAERAPIAPAQNAGVDCLRTVDRDVVRAVSVGHDSG